jgi:hypothetical protein
MSVLGDIEVLEETGQVDGDAFWHHRLGRNDPLASAKGLCSRLTIALKLFRRDRPTLKSAAMALCSADSLLRRNLNRVALGQMNLTRRNALLVRDPCLRTSKPYALPQFSGRGGIPHRR